MATQDEINRADIFLRTIAGQIETLKQELYDLSDETGFYALATDWQETMSMVEALKNNQYLTPEQKKRFDDLLDELEKVKPIAEKLNLI
ncbi:MAG: hypothetical protein WHV44_00170 [Anaerolineales bacterium]|jgi:predicted translin family RNA/ssDNA-binding protein